MTKLTLDSTFLAKLAYVYSFAPKRSISKFLNVVYFNIHDNVVEMVSTDGKTMAFATCKYEGNSRCYGAFGLPVSIVNEILEAGKNESSYSLIFDDEYFEESGKFVVSSGNSVEWDCGNSYYVDYRSILKSLECSTNTTDHAFGINMDFFAKLNKAYKLAYSHTTVKKNTYTARTSVCMYGDKDILKVTYTESVLKDTFVIVKCDTSYA